MFRMKLSANTRYAIRILFELHEAAVPLSISTLSQKTGIALRTIENVHTVLKRHGVTGASVGAKGGIALRRRLDTVSLGRIVAWFDDGVEFAVCCGDKGNECPQQDECRTRAAWRKVSARVQRELDAILLSDILRDFSESGPISLSNV